jgi:DNA invertase Pin-like site-specific DNA recombinase
MRTSAELRAFAATQGWRIKREYVDGATGKNCDREQFKALFNAASRREFELVLFWSLDRFSREGLAKRVGFYFHKTANSLPLKDIVINLSG